MQVNDSAIAHLEALARILRDLADQRIELVEHRYHAMAFGSFELVLGKGHDLLKFAWDGKESLLVLYFATVQNRSGVQAWTHDADFSLPGAVGLYEEIASLSVDMLEQLE